LSEKLEEFKAFIKKHPLLKTEVQSGKKTWQELYEDFVLLGDDSYEEKVNDEVKEEKKDEAKKGTINPENLINSVMGYVKKIDPDTITKTVTSIQKVIELFGSFGAGASSTALTKKSTGDPLFDKRFDQWY
jgi:predicted ATP-dependent endonuclease of OLD family